MTRDFTSFIRSPRPKPTQEGSKKGSNPARTTFSAKFQALVYDILPPTSGIPDYAMYLRKLSANEKFSLDETSRDELFFYSGRLRLMFTCVLEHHAASTVLLVPRLFGGHDSVRGQLRGERECPISGVTNSGRVGRKVPESDGRSVVQCCTVDFAEPQKLSIFC